MHLHLSVNYLTSVLSESALGFWYPMRDGNVKISTVKWGVTFYWQKIVWSHEILSSILLLCCARNTLCYVRFCCIKHFCVYAWQRFDLFMNNGTLISSLPELNSFCGIVLLSNFRLVCFVMSIFSVVACLWWYVYAQKPIIHFEHLHCRTPCSIALIENISISAKESFAWKHRVK